MMDIGIASAPPGADLVAVAKGGRSAKQDDGDGKGFLDALTSSRGNGRKSDATAPDDTDTTDAATGTDTGADADADTVKNSAGDPTATTPATPPPMDDSSIGAGMIDPSASNIAALAELAKGSKQPGVAKFPQGAAASNLSKSLVDLQTPAEADTAPADKAEATDPASNADATDILGQTQAQTSDQLDNIAQQLADVIAGNQPVQGNGDGKTQAPAPGKTSKTTSTDDDGKASATQSTQSGGAASDALSLLNVPQAAAGAVAAAPQNAANVFAGADGKTQAEPDQPLPKLADVTLKNASANATDADTTPSSVADATATAQTFRLVRADGRGGALDMSISKTSSDDTAQVDVKASSGGNAETVTVLDSRRYLGLAANSNAALVTSAMAGDGEWSGAMQPASALSNAASWTSTGKVVNTLKIQLHPNDLGQVTATMRLSGDQLSVDLKVQTSEAYRQLHADQSHMVDALRAQGYQVDNITVTLASNADQQSDSGRQSGFQGQSQQQSLLNQGQGGDARPRGQSYSGQQANGNDGNRGSSERGTEDGAAGTAQRLRSGDVYL
ncbi:flagellar hook-length control protein FliK [Rhizobium sp. BR 362]|uniref:flagellar hook-length control protein FliK n=1 Tax=Rhizobium sp. BR 362 TaxID=3040670 RepID=UPI002F3FD206